MINSIHFFFFSYQITARKYSTFFSWIFHTDFKNKHFIVQTLLTNWNVKRKCNKKYLREGGKFWPKKKERREKIDINWYHIWQITWVTIGLSTSIGKSKQTMVNQKIVHDALDCIWANIYWKWFLNKFDFIKLSLLKLILKWNHLWFN